MWQYDRCWQMVKMCKVMMGRNTIGPIMGMCEIIGQSRLGKGGGMQFNMVMESSSNAKDTLEKFLVHVHKNWGKGMAKEINRPHQFF